MLDFREIQLSDKPWIESLLCKERVRSADYSFSNMYLWCKSFKLRVSEMNGRLAATYGCGNTFRYSYPVGSGPLAPAIELLREDAALRGRPFHLSGLTKEMLPALQSLYPDSFDLAEDRAYFDYVYSAEKLSLLAGKKLHSKRNHINRFTQEYNWSFEPMTEDNLSECAAMNEKWLELAAEERDMSFADEHAAIGAAFRNFSALGLEGGILRVDGDVIAFAIGDKLCGDTYDIHFEKAIHTIEGAYTMINREFARYITQKHPDVLYINREDDIGLENLRKSKMSYYPDFLVEKYTAIWR